MRSLTRLSPLIRPRLSTPRPISLSTQAPTATTIRLASSFESAPSPPRLPPDEQAEFERLQRTAAVAMTESSAPIPQLPTRMPPPEFDGDKNPRTGEVGGPKHEPLRWGGQGDWSYHGRVTDF